MRILGIDPGLAITGYGLVRLPAGAMEPVLVEAGVIRLPARQSLSKRLKQLHDELDELLEELQPQRVAVEKLYAHYKHPRTAILMAHARGVILLAAQARGLELEDLPSTAVKKAVSGYGHASKQQMQRSIQMQCGLKQMPSPPDVADAIAIALTSARRLGGARL